MRICRARDAARKVSGACGRRGLLDGISAEGIQTRARQDQALSELEQADLAKAGALGAREHQMIEHRAVQSLHRGRKAARAAAVGIARPRIAAWVIVREDDPGAAMLCGVGDDASQRKVRPAFVA